MQIHDIDWRMVARSWDPSGIQYVIGILNEVLSEKMAACTRRKTIIRRDGNGT